MNVQTTTEHTLRIMCDDGDQTVTWDPRDPASVNQAREKFNALRASGHQIYHMNVVEENGIVVEERGDRIDEFDPHAGKLLAAPQLRGG